jgi:hypothetical protein
MRVQTVSIAATLLLGGGVLAACRPVVPPPTPPPPTTTTTTAAPALPALTPAKWTSPNLDGTIQAQPVLFPDPSLLNGVGVVVVATENDSVYGLNPVDGTMLWGPISIGTPQPLSENDAFGPVQTLSGCGDINPLGITSNPVLDNGSVWVVGEREHNPAGSSPHQPEHVIAGINPVNGDFVLNPVVIDPPAMTVATVGSTQNEVSAEQQRTGLVATNGHVYVGFGGLSGDCGPYHGFVVDVSETDGSIGGYFESATASTVTNDREGAVWAPGGIAVDSSTSTIYAATGNSADGSSPPASGDNSDAVVQLPFPLPSSPTNPTHVFQPSTFASDNQSDLDLGSSAPLLVDNGTQVFQIGKRGTGYLLNKSDLSLVTQLSVCSGGTFGNVVTLGTSIFVPCRGSVMKQLVLGSGTMSAGWTSPSDVAAGGPATVDPISNLVFSADSGSNQLFGVNVSTGAAMMRYQLALTGSEHFPTPGVGNGQVFIESGLTVKAFPT